MGRYRTPLAVCLICWSHVFFGPRLAAVEANVSGTWVADDPSAYRLTLEQNGANVTGSYSLQNGQVSGTFTNGVLRITWQQSGNRRGGTATLTLRDLYTLSGSWQYDPRMFNSGLTGGGTWTFRRPKGQPSPMPGTPTPPPSVSPSVQPPARPISIEFGQFNPGPLPANALSSHGITLVSEGTPTIAKAGPEMVLPPGLRHVFQIGGGPTTSATFSFTQAIRKFGLVRIGVTNGASVPTWKLEALDRSGRVIDTVGEVHGTYPQPRAVSVKGLEIASVRLTTDNRYGTGTWATYNSLPVAEMQVELSDSSPPALTASPIPTVTPLPVPSPSLTPFRPSPPPAISPRQTVAPSPIPTPPIIASPRPSPSPRPSLTPTPPRETPSPTATAPLTKTKSRTPPGLGKPEAVIAALKKSAVPAPAGARDEPIADGIFVVQRPDAWQVTDATDRSAMFVSDELPNTGVLFEWEAGRSPAPGEILRRLKEEHPDAEAVGEGAIGTLPAQRFAWVEVAEPERREALFLSWTAGDLVFHATAIAPSTAWEQHSEKIFAILNGRAGEKKATKPKAKATPSPTPEESPSPTATASPTASPSPTPSATKAPLLTVAGGIVEARSLAPAKGRLETKTIADGVLTVRFDETWQISDEGTSYTVFSAAKFPELTVWIQWSDGKGKSLDQVANDALAKLRRRFTTLDALSNRTIAGVPARQVAWVTGEGNEKRENLQLDWLLKETLFKATIAAPPEIWQKEGGQILRLLEGLSEGGR